MTWSVKSKLKQVVSREKGTIIKDWGGKITVAVVYPNTYHIGMSNLGVHNIYRLLNSRDDVVCERAFLPEKQDMEEYLRKGDKILTLETNRPLQDFDIIAFSISFENDVKNIQAISDLAGIPSDKTKRQGGRHPKLVVGGAVSTLIPDIFKDLFDEVFVGDAEDSLSKLLNSGESEIIKEPARSVIWTDDTEFGSMHLVEMQRGCPHRCKFCAAPVIYSPFKQFSKEAIIKAIDAGIEVRKKIGLIGGDVFAHPDFEEIVSYIHSRGAVFSPSSVRADRITPAIAKLLKLSKHKTITLAPETGSEGLRKSLGKNIPDLKFFDAAKVLMEEGINQFKLYFMIGLPGETKDDIMKIADFVDNFKKPGIRTISVSANPFIPKMSTAFENEPFAGVEGLREKTSLLKKAFRGMDGVKVKIESPLTAHYEYCLQSARRING